MRSSPPVHAVPASVRWRRPWLRLLLAAVLGLLGVMPAAAVDGYKNFKFGLRPRQVEKLSPVPLESIENEGWSDAYGHDCIVLAAGNFPMLDSEREVNFVFTKDGLVSIAFVLEPSEFVPVSKTLNEKYGGGKLQPNPQEFQQMAARFDAGQPHSMVKITFDNDSVVLVGTRDADGEATMVLVYTNPEAANPATLRPDDL